MIILSVQSKWRKSSLKEKTFHYTSDMTRVLVTGASGFLAMHVVKQLLDSGEYIVRGTVRSLANEKKVKPLKMLCQENAKDQLELAEADLTKKESWVEWVKSLFCSPVLSSVIPYNVRIISDITFDLINLLVTRGNFELFGISVCYNQHRSQQTFQQFDFVGVQTAYTIFTSRISRVLKVSLKNSVCVWYCRRNLNGVFVIQKQSWYKRV